MAKVMIVYASLTGNTRAGAEIITDAFLDLGADVELTESYIADPFDYEDYDIVVAGAYTYCVGGQLPDEMVDFYEELAEVDLSGKLYGAFGSGDEFYEDLYCVAVDALEEQFEKAGATRGATAVKYNLHPDVEAEEALTAFAKELLENYESMN